MNWERIKELTADVFGVSMSIFMLWHLYLIATKGSFYVGEQNPLVLGFELFVTVGFLVLTLERYWADTTEKVKAIGRKLIENLKCHRSNPKGESKCGRKS